MQTLSKEKTDAKSNSVLNAKTLCQSVLTKRSKYRHCRDGSFVALHRHQWTTPSEKTGRSLASMPQYTAALFSCQLFPAKFGRTFELPGRVLKVYVYVYTRGLSR